MYLTLNTYICFICWNQFLFSYVIITYIGVNIRKYFKSQFMGRGRRYLSTTKNHKSNESMEIRKIFSSILVSTTEYYVMQMNKSKYV